jgi:hypothetical protein
VDKKRVNQLVNEIFTDLKAQLTDEGGFDMTFHVFFDDGFWRFNPGSLSKQQAYRALNIFLTESRTLAYSVTSDCNLLDPVTKERIGEQLLSVVVTPDGSVDGSMQPYIRLPNGEIQYEKMIANDELRFFGDLTSFYHSTQGIPEEVKKGLTSIFNARIAAEKIPYRSAYTKEESGPTFH